MECFEDLVGFSLQPAAKLDESKMLTKRLHFKRATEVGRQIRETRSKSSFILNHISTRDYDKTITLVL